jgi:hypothetical protein
LPLFQDNLPVAIKNFRCLSGRYFTREPLKEFDFQCFFKILDMPTDRGLRDP